MRKHNSIFIFVFILAMSLVAEPCFAASIGIAGRINKNVKSLKEIRHQNIEAQSLDYSCGPASLATLLSYYFGDKVTEVDVLETLLTTCDIEKVKAKKGFSLLDLKRFAQSRGYDVVGYKMDLEFLVELDKPVLIPVSIKDYSHFVIFRGLEGDRVFIADPVLGNMTMRYEKFERIWEGGIGLVLNGRDDEKLKDSPLRISGQEEAVFADATTVRRLFGVNSLGTIFADGEF
ncbi:MAG: C39 family peptidase [Candidatus Gorgyraea atricola]|nr:C39 family peptidase [Candidatus Gorgyraea atricola]